MPRIPLSWFPPSPLPGWFSDLALELRLPALAALYHCYRTTAHYFDACRYFEERSGWASTRGTLLQLERHTYRHHYLPRYSVVYEFTVNGERYESRRSATGSLYPGWVLEWLPTGTDVITEVQYLQATPPMRVGSPCTVFYHKKNPRLCGIAHDACSFECSVLGSVSVLVLIWATLLKRQVRTGWRGLFPRTYKVRLPRTMQTGGAGSNGKQLDP